MAVRLQLPKTTLEDLSNFFSEDDLRYDEVKKYLLEKVPMDDSKTFMPDVFRRLLTDEVLLACPTLE